MIKPLLDGKPPKPKKKANGRVTLTRQYELITPLFGGGVEANVVDVENPIKGTAVRGQLRFWWRATRGGQFGKDGLKAMKAREDEIFGAAATDKDGEKRPLPLQIAVRIDKKNKQEYERDLDYPFIHVRGNSKPNPKSITPAYAAFPLQRTKEEIRDGETRRTVQKNIAFTLDVNFHTDYREDIEMALWAWETFGGIGARTRRGFGALHCTAAKENGKSKPLPPTMCDAAAIKKEIKKRLKKVDGQWPRNVPHLSPKMPLEIVPTNGDAESVWNWLIKALQAFRQSRVGGKHGATHWPEANAVRRAAGKPISSKSPDMEAKFPRAQLGLPILFHFPQDSSLDATLSGATKERMASRLILRPLACGYGSAVGLSASLIGPIIPEGGLALDESPVVDGTKIDHRLSISEANKIVPLDGTPSLIKAFFEYIRS